MKKTKTNKEPKTTMINISNNPSDNWVREQIEGFDKVIDIPYPRQYNPADINNLANYMLEKINEILEKETKKKKKIYITIQYTEGYMLLYSILYTRIVGVIKDRYKDYKYGIRYAEPTIKKIFNGWVTYKL